MIPEYESEQVRRDRFLVIRVTTQFEVLHQGLTRWLGDEIIALRNECQKLEVQASDESLKRGFDDLQLRLAASDGQLTRNQRRMSRKLEEALADNPGMGDPLESFDDLADELIHLEGLMRRLLDIRALVDKAITELP